MEKKYTNIPILIFKTEEDKKVFSPIDYYLQRTTGIRENLILIITTHILTEFIVNKVLESKYNTSEKLLQNKGYYEKIKLIHSLNLISDEMHKNLVALNRLRNQYAHQLKPPKEKLKSICKEFTFCKIALGEEKLDNAVGDYDFLKYCVLGL